MQRTVLKFILWIFWTCSECTLIRTPRMMTPVGCRSRTPHWRFDAHALAAAAHDGPVGPRQLWNAALTARSVCCPGPESSLRPIARSSTLNWLPWSNLGRALNGTVVTVNHRPSTGVAPFSAGPFVLGPSCALVWRAGDEQLTLWRAA